MKVYFPQLNHLSHALMIIIVFYFASQSYVELSFCSVGVIDKVQLLNCFITGGRYCRYGYM